MSSQSRIIPENKAFDAALSVPEDERTEEEQTVVDDYMLQLGQEVVGIVEPHILLAYIAGNMSKNAAWLTGHGHHTYAALSRSTGKLLEAVVDNMISVEETLS